MQGGEAEAWRKKKKPMEVGPADQHTHSVWEYAAEIQAVCSAKQLYIYKLGLTNAPACSNTDLR